MRYLIDTNVVVDFFTGRYPVVIERFRSSSPHDIATSAVAVAELRYGADKSERAAENHGRLDRFLEEVAVLEFNDAAAFRYGKLRSELEAEGKVIGPNDMLIAAQALAAGLVLVTDNESEFGRVAGLIVENWRT